MKMKFRYVIFLSIALVMITDSCLQKKSITGKEFVPRDVLVDVLVDLHMVDAITNDRKFHRRYEADSIDVLTPIFEKYGVTLQMFDTTMAEYSRFPDLMDQVYNEVLIKLNVMLDENEKSDETNTPEA